MIIEIKDRDRPIELDPFMPEIMSIKLFKSIEDTYYFICQECGHISLVEDNEAMNELKAIKHVLNCSYSPLYQIDADLILS